MITSAYATALARLSWTKLSSSGSVDLHGARFRWRNKYAGTYAAKKGTLVVVFADGAQIRVRICAPGARLRGGGGREGRIRCYTGHWQRRKLAISSTLKSQGFALVERQQELLVAVEPRRRAGINAGTHTHRHTHTHTHTPDNRLRSPKVYGLTGQKKKLGNFITFLCVRRVLD